jgi:hypothetical protein
MLSMDSMDHYDLVNQQMYHRAMFFKLAMGRITDEKANSEIGSRMMERRNSLSVSDDTLSTSACGSVSSDGDSEEMMIPDTQVFQKQMQLPSFLPAMENDGTPGAFAAAVAFGNQHQSKDNGRTYAKTTALEKKQQQRQQQLQQHTKKQSIDNDGTPGAFAAAMTAAFAKQPTEKQPKNSKPSRSGKQHALAEKTTNYPRGCWSSVDENVGRCQPMAFRKPPGLDDPPELMPPPGLHSASQNNDLPQVAGAVRVTL